jgi:hypothetical protein
MFDVWSLICHDYWKNDSWRSFSGVQKLSERRSGPKGPKMNLGEFLNPEGFKS